MWFSEVATAARIPQLDVKDENKKVSTDTSFCMYCVCACETQVEVIEGRKLRPCPHPSWASTSAKPEHSLSRKKEEMTQLEQEVLQGDQ